MHGYIHNPLLNTTAQRRGKRMEDVERKRGNGEIRSKSLRGTSVISETVWEKRVEEQKLSVSLTLTFGFLVENPLYHPGRKHKHQWLRLTSKHRDSELDGYESAVEYARQRWLEHFPTKRSLLTQKKRNSILRALTLQLPHTVRKNKKKHDISPHTGKYSAIMIWG